MPDGVPCHLQRPRGVRGAPAPGAAGLVVVCATAAARVPRARPARGVPRKCRSASGLRAQVGGDSGTRGCHGGRAQAAGAMPGATTEGRTRLWPSQPWPGSLPSSHRRPRRHVGSHPGRRRPGPPADQTPGRPGGDWKFRWGLDAVPACRSARGLPQGWGCANEGSPPRPAWLCLAPLPANCQWNFPCCAQTAGLRGEGVGLARPPARCTQGPLNPCWPGFSPSGSQLPPPPPTHLSHRSGQSPPCPPVQLLHEGFTPRPPKGTAWASVC